MNNSRITETTWRFLAVRVLLASMLSLAGIYPVMYWPYDLGGAASVFFTVRDGRGGAQIDMISDPRARGNYAVRTDVLLEGAVPGSRWMKIGAIDELIYLVRKRHFKGQADRLKAAVDALRSYSEAEVRSRVRALVPGRIRGDIERLLDNGATDRKSPRPFGYRFGTAVRLLVRVVRPIGLWVSVPEAPVAPPGTAGSP